MQRKLAIGILVLAVAAVGLAWFVRDLERRSQQRLLQHSRHERIASESTTVEALDRFELMLPGSAESWTYRRGEIGWRLPGYHDGFAETPRVEAILAAVVDGRGTLVGHLPGEARHFGLTPEARLAVALFDARGRRLDRIHVGRVAPGNRGAETYMNREGHDAIYHVAANPWPAAERAPDGADPPLLDRRLIPGALGRRPVREIRLAGPACGPFRAIDRVDLEPDLLQRQPGEGPLHEWYGLGADGKRQKLEALPAYAYTGSLLESSYQTLLDRPPGEAGERLLCRLTLTYDAREEAVTSDTLELYSSAADVFVLANLTTRQLFGLDATTAAALLPSPDRLPFSG